MTLTIMLILAGISLSGLIGGRGLFQRTEKASNRYNEAKARETLETVLLTDGQFEKNTNPEYNQDDFLDELIKKEIPGSKVIEDVAIVDGYGYELDRSVPKIGRYLGKPKDLVWPKVTTTESVLADDYRSASFTITATIDEKATKGIERIEVWLLGEIVKKYEYTDNTKNTRTETYETNRNGKYIIKAYADLMGSARTTVEGVVPAVEFSPKGNTEWKKQHSTKITVKETGEKIKSLKYKWINSAKAPDTGEFTDAENCSNNDTITGKDVTGTYYLWILLETETGKTNICGSEGFKFDNVAPKITSFTATPNSATAITLSVTAQDTKAGVVKFEFYVDNVPKDTRTYNATTSSVTEEITVSELSTGSHSCKVIVYDAEDNSRKTTTSGSTKLYTWDLYKVNEIREYVIEKGETFDRYVKTAGTVAGLDLNCASSMTLDKETGEITVRYYSTHKVGAASISNPLYNEVNGKYEAYTSLYSKKIPDYGGVYQLWVKGYYFTSKLKNTRYEQGESTGKTVTSVTKSYPDNGVSGSYWYVYKGLY